MNVEIEQWIRVDNNFYKVVALYKKRFIAQAIDHKRRFNYKNIIEVKNTPQELIVVRDLVKYDGWILELDELGVVNLKEDNYKQITEILTPNFNGGYDLQYKI